MHEIHDVSGCKEHSNCGGEHDQSCAIIAIEMLYCIGAQLEEDGGGEQPVVDFVAAAINNRQSEMRTTLILSLKYKYSR
jgi:hypothetical protein